MVHSRCPSLIFSAMHILNRVTFAALFLLSVFASSGHAQDPLVQRERPGLDVKYGWKNKVKPRLDVITVHGPQAAASAAGPVSGTLRLPIVILEFIDHPIDFSPASVRERFVGEPADATSAYEYFKQMSFDRLTVTGEVSPVLQMPATSEYYVGNRGSGIAQRLEEYLFDALARAEAHFDWRLFDNDGPDGIPNSGDDDGRVDVVVFVFGSEDGACSGASNNHKMWSHRWNLSSARGQPFQTSVTAPNGERIVIDDYITVPLYSCDGTSIAGPGTLIHELGHVLGLPDLYAVGNSTAQGAGFFSIMASGNYLTPEYPTALDAWSRSVLGWVDVKEVSNQVGQVIQPVHESAEVIQVTDTVSGEFVLLEYRTRTEQADKFLPNEGLLIWQIDPDRLEENWESNTVNSDPERMGVALIQADGQMDLERGVNRGDAGDVWPGSHNKTAFTPTTTPAAVTLEDKTPLGFRLDRINLASGVATLDITPTHRYWAKLKLSASVEGARAFIGDSLVTLPFTGEFPVDSTITIRIDTSATGDQRIRFVEWSDGSTEHLRDIYFATRDSVVLEAQTIREFRVVVPDADPALGTVHVLANNQPISGNSWVEEGAAVRVWAMSETGKKFLYWDGTAMAMNPAETARIPADTTFALEGPIQIKAVFVDDYGEGLEIAPVFMQNEAALPEEIRAFLDLRGNQNNRFDIGDLILGLKNGDLIHQDGRIIFNR